MIYRISFSCLRFTSHRLRVVTGRFSRIAWNRCLCPCGQIQDEAHVLLIARLLCTCNTLKEIAWISMIFYMLMVWGTSGWPLDSTVVLVVIYLSGCSVYFWEPHSRINGAPGSVWGSLTNVLVVCVHWSHWSVSDGSVVKDIALDWHTDTDYDRAALAWNPCHVIYQIQHKIFWWPDACWAAGHKQQLCWHRQWHLVITGQRLDWCVHQRRGCLPWWHPIKSNWQPTVLLVIAGLPQWRLDVSGIL